MIKTLVVVVIAWLFFVLGLAVVVSKHTEEPYCPTEDSCAVHYDGDRDTWVVEEVTP